MPSESSSSFMAERNIQEAPSLAAAICSDILIPSFIAFSRPPPSPLNAGPRHSGRLINNLTTKLAFSCTVSPDKANIPNISNKLNTAVVCGHRIFLSFASILQEYRFSLAFDFCRFCVVIRGFSPQPQRPMNSDFKGFSISDFIHYIYFPILILEKEPVFSLLNVQC